MTEAVCFRFERGIGKVTSEFTIAVHALVFLNHKGTVYSSEGLAENVCTNAARIRKVMAKLKKAGLVKTKEGVDGGYLFQLDSKEVNLSMVAEALEAPFVSASWKSGDAHMACLISSGMAGIMDELYGELNQCCQEYLKKVTIADLDSKIFTCREKAVKIV